MVDVRQNVKAGLLPFSKRLSTALAKAGGLQAVVRTLNKPRATVDRWANAQAEPSILDAAKLAAVCGVSLAWLATGVDEPTSEHQDVSNLVNIPILDLHAGAGSAIENGEVETVGEMPFPREVLQRLGIKPDRVRALRGRGVSMEPTISDGSLVLVNIAKERLVDGQVYALRAPDGLRIKRLQRQMDGSLLLISDNRELFEPERIPPHEAEQIGVLGRVFWTEKLL